MCLDRIHEYLNVTDNSFAEVVSTLFSALTREIARLGQNISTELLNINKNKNSDQNSKTMKDNNIDINNLQLDIEELKLENE
jgi:hypothetical protein